MIQKKPANVKTWTVEVTRTRYVDNIDCPARTKKNKIWWCDELDKKCCSEDCMGCEDFS